MRLSQKPKKQKDFLVPSPKKNSPGRKAQTLRAGTGDSVDRFRRYRCSTLFNYHSNLSMCGTFLHLPDNRRLLATPKLIYDLDFSNDDDCFCYHSWRNNVVIAF